MSFGTIAALVITAYISMCLLTYFLAEKAKGSK